MKYRVGQSVRVKAGLMAPDDPDMDLSGWQGRVYNICDGKDGHTCIGIKWDSLTLDGIPQTYLEESEEEGLFWDRYDLYEEDLEPAQPRDSKSNVEHMLARIGSRIEWLHLGEQGKRIQALFNREKATDDSAHCDAWSKHVRNTLKIPFQAKVREPLERGPLRFGVLLKVFEFEIDDDTHGIIMKCHKGGRRYDFPLSRLAAVDKSSSNAQLIRDYQVWFANR